MFKFEYKILPVKGKKDTYNLAVTKKTIIQTIAFAAGLNLAGIAVVYVIGLLTAPTQEEIDALTEQLYTDEK